MDIAGITFLGVIVVAIFYQCKIYPIGIRKDSMSVENSKSIKGIIAVLIILHHISSIVPDAKVLAIMKYVGYLLVGIFFLYSGYGLMKSFQTKENYLDSFISRRIPTILIPFFLINSIYVLVLAIFYGRAYTVVQIIKYILGVELINSYAWYTVMILVYYLAFYCFFKFFKQKKAMIGISIFVVISILFRIQFRETQWFLSEISFLVGILFRYHKENVLDFMRRKYTYLIINGLAGFLLFFLLGFIIEKKGVLIKNVVMIVTSLFFTISVILINEKVLLKNKITLFLGQISYEMYLIHKIILFVVKDYISYQHLIVYTSTCLLITILVAYVIQKIDKKMIQWVISKGTKPNRIKRLES